MSFAKSRLLRIPAGQLVLRLLHLVWTLGIGLSHLAVLGLEEDTVALECTKLATLLWWRKLRQVAHHQARADDANHPSADVPRR